MTHRKNRQKQVTSWTYRSRRWKKRGWDKFQGQGDAEAQGDTIDQERDAADGGTGELQRAPETKEERKEKGTLSIKERGSKVNPKDQESSGRPPLPALHHPLVLGLQKLLSIQLLLWSGVVLSLPDSFISHLLFVIQVSSYAISLDMALSQTL